MRDTTSIQVFADWKGLEQPTLMGTLEVAFVRGKEVFSFEYDTDWLQTKRYQRLDPRLGLYAGKQFPAVGKRNFGLFLDSCPDRWGRFLLQRRETIQARKQNRNPHRLYESDYLLGVHDVQRMGAIRFQVHDRFMDDNAEYAAPPWTSLSTLEHISQQVENDDNLTHPDYERWLHMLLAPGSSLGGARPKANVVDENGQLWVAKFPSRNDTVDVGLWEGLANQLAKDAGIQVSESKIQRFASTEHTFLSKRFDRQQHQRIHFASAMTLLERDDGDDYSNGASYLEMVEFIEQQGAQPKQDLMELWRRIVFSASISNTDDHLRNHGFLLAENGWALSPAYDLNPNPQGYGLKLNISETDNSQDIDLLREVAPYFHLSTRETETILSEVIHAVRKWNSLANTLGISSHQQELFEPAFRLVE